MRIDLKDEHRIALMTNMCDNLSVFRAKLNISQDDLADKLGITRQTISAFESGQRGLTWSIFLALILIFFRNQKTKNMLVSLEIYTQELDAFLTIPSNKLDDKK